MAKAGVGGMLVRVSGPTDLPSNDTGEQMVAPGMGGREQMAAPGMGGRRADLVEEEVAVEVADDLHRLGLATLLVIHLAKFAESSQITRFFAGVLPENHDMLAVFHDGFAAVTVNGRDETKVEFPTSAWRAAHARFEG